MEQCAPAHFWGPASRPEYHLHIILEGEGYLEMNKETYHLKKGQIFVLPPDTIVHYYADFHHPWYYAWASFNGNKASIYLKQAGFTQDTLIRDCIISPEDFATIIHQMLLANSQTAEDELKRMGYLFHLLALLARSNVDVAVPKQTLSASTYVEHAIQYIEYNYNNDILISDIANYLDLNRSYFTEIFKQYTKLTPKDYLLKFRMEKAQDMLSHTSLSIIDISQKVGYKDPFTFSKMFKRFSGLSPTQFRKEQQAE